ncbi:hypothetical protein NO2_1107 [Candidatus Termititenax persephonae]|uniref:Autotransporter domain-containing protein n=1 Tax=Candidatus Termititenax persephonae TaxID=2218525 RepID=A0A388THY4_9BACT|nr:hypothetical protein NO2_1107 [Candidatus Termititenax persephonae]
MPKIKQVNPAKIIGDNLTASETENSNIENISLSEPVEELTEDIISIISQEESGAASELKTDGTNADNTEIPKSTSMSEDDAAIVPPDQIDIAGGQELSENPPPPIAEESADNEQNQVVEEAGEFVNPPRIENLRNPQQSRTPAEQLQGKSVTFKVEAAFGGQSIGQVEESALSEYKPDEESIGRSIVLEMKNDPDNSYNIFTGAINKYKDNPETLDNLVSAVSAELRAAANNYEVSIYESRNIATGEIASSPQEIFRLWSSTEGEVSNTICGTIHGAVMQALNDCGIEAAVVNTVTGDANAMHYTLMYKVGEGQYIFNNYGNSVSVAAPNVLEAIKSVQKNNQTGDHSDGFVSICNDQGNMTEYALTDIAVFGAEVDKYSDIMQGLNPEQKECARGLYIATSGQLTQDLTDFAVTLGYTWDTKHGWINLEGGAQTNGESSMANESWSAGAKLHTFFQGELAGITFGVENRFIASNTNPTTGNSDENTYNHNIITLAEKLRLFAEKDIFNSDTAGRLTATVDSRLGIAVGIVPSNDEDKAGLNGGMGDIGLSFGGGLRYTNTFGGLIFGAHASARGLFNYNRNYTNESIFEFKFDNTGYQVAGGLSIGSSNQQGFVWNVGADTAYMQDANQSRFSASGVLGLGYLNPLGTSINGTLGVEYNERNLYGMFNEKTGKGFTTSAGISATLKNNITISADVLQDINLLGQNSSFSPTVKLGIDLSFW